MQSFTIVTPIYGVIRQEVEIVLNSFSQFYYSVTKKHRSNLNLVLLFDNEIQLDIIRLAKTLNINDAVIAVWNNKIELPSLVLNNPSIMFLPFFKEKPEWISLALFNGLPVLSYEMGADQLLLDNSCGMQITNLPNEESIAVFAGWLKMLYFDPGAFEMLRKGAKSKYNVVLPLRNEQYLTKVA